MKPEGILNGPCEIHGYSDTYYAVDNDTQKIVTGFIIIINRVVIA